MLKYSRVIFILSCLFFIYGCFNKDLHIDEAILGEHVYRLAEEGVVRNEMFKGYGFGGDVKQLHFHKLFVYLGALITNYSGINLSALRHTSPIFLLIFLLYFRKYTLSIFGENTFYLASSLILIYYKVFQHGFIFRPEIMLMCFGFISFYYLNKNKYLIAGIFAGLAMFTHLNGVIFIFAGFFYLLIQKKYSSTFIFGLIASIFGLLYFVDIIYSGDLNNWYYQFRNDPFLAASQDSTLGIELDHFSVSSILIKLVNEHRRLLHSPAEIILIISAVIGIFINYKNQKNISNYFLLVALFLSIIAHDKTTKYLILYIPFIATLVAYSLDRSKYIKYIIIVYLIINIVFNIGSIETESITKRNKKLAEFIPENSNVFTRETFWFNQAEKYNIHSTLAYDWSKKGKANSKTSLEDFFNFAYKYDNRFILIDKKNINNWVMKEFRSTHLKLDSTYWNYNLIKKENEYYLFERK